MKRVLAGVMLAVLLWSTGSGCCMCRAPYDYCGPTFSGCGDACWSHERMGSAFTSYAPGEPEGEPAEAAPAEPVPAEPGPAPPTRNRPDA